MVENRFGSDFAAAVFGAEPGAWSGPIASVYGYHLVLVGRRTAARIPDFGEVAERIATELDTQRRSGALDRIYASVRDAYAVEIEPAAAEPQSHPSHAHSHDDRHSHESRTRA
jgi:parvulin-like peptidyl-prolyl isomerase